MDKLDFTTLGMEESQYVDLPIYVNKIYPDGAVGNDGCLHKGDELLSVNGVPYFILLFFWNYFLNALNSLLSLSILSQ